MDGSRLVRPDRDQRGCHATPLTNFVAQMPF